MGIGKRPFINISRKFTFHRINGVCSWAWLKRVIMLIQTISATEQER